MLAKNVAGQGVYLYAHDYLNDVPKTGNATSITGTISKDGAGTAATATANPTEIGGGVYWQPLSQAETNADALAVAWVSATANIKIDPLIVLTDKGVKADIAAGGTGLTAQETANAMKLAPAAGDGAAGSLVAQAAAIKAKTDLITTGTEIATFSGVMPSGELTIYAGMDYAGSLALPWTVTGYVGPSLVGGTAIMRLLTVADYEGAVVATALEYTGTVSQSGTTLTIAIPMTAAETAVLATNPPDDVRNYRYQVQGITSAGTGSLKVMELDNWATVKKAAT